MCDVLPLKFCDVILGCPWLVDRNAHHVAHADTYMVVEGCHKYTPTCAHSHMPFM